MSTPLLDRPAPLVSVVIPSYNAATTLPESLASLLVAQQVELEVIVVNDGSTDTTFEVLMAYGADSRVRVISQANGGLAHARNTGCLAARGRYIAFLDADDLALPGRLAWQVAVLEADAAIAICAGEFSAFGADGYRSEGHAAHYYSQLSEPGSLCQLLPQVLPFAPVPGTRPVRLGDCSTSLLRGNFLHPPTLMFRREVFERAGNFDIALGQCDWEWLTRACQFGKVAYIDTPLIDYRLSATQMSASGNLAWVELGILAVRAKLLARSGALGDQVRSRLRADYCASLVDCADALVDSDRRAALRHIGLALRMGGISPTWCKVALKALLPRPVLAAIRAASNLDPRRLAKQPIGHHSS